MRDLKKIRKWFWVWEFEEEEQWLNQMAESGWVLEKVGFAVYCFRQCEPGAYTIRMEMREHDENYLAFMKEMDAVYVGRMAKWIYFRRKTELGDFRIFSDLESRMGQLEKIGKTLKAVGIANLLIGITNTFNSSFSRFPLGWINLLCAALCFYCLGRLQGKLDVMKKERAIME